MKDRCIMQVETPRVVRDWNEAPNGWIILAERAWRSGPSADFSWMVDD